MAKDLLARALCAVALGGQRAVGTLVRGDAIRDLEQVGAGIREPPFRAREVRTRDGPPVRLERGVALVAIEGRGGHLLDDRDPADRREVERLPVILQPVAEAAGDRRRL